jgi:predicted nucleic acid-binding protein
VAETDSGLLDIEPADLPDETSVSALTLAELSAGTHATDDPAERARRQDRLQQLESWVEPLAFDADCAREYGRVYAAVVAAGRQPRRRAVDLLIAATALAAGLPLYTRNADDFRGLEGLVTVVSV